MKLRHIALISSGVGITLVVVSLCLTYLILPAIPATVSWTDEEAEAYSSAAMEYHKLSFDKTISPEELADTAATYETHREKLDAAISRRSNVPRYIRYGGIFCVILGLGFYVGGIIRDEK